MRRAAAAKKAAKAEAAAAGVAETELEATPAQPPAPVMAAPAPTPASAHEKREQVAALLGGILERMAYPAKLDFKDMADGGVGVAMHFEGELPGITPNKRSYLIDCLQFLVNKVVNRPNVEKRWVSLGINAFPEPRPVRPEAGVPAAAAQQAPAPVAAKSPASARASAPPAAAAAAKKPHEHSPGHANNKVDEKSLKVEPSPTMTRLGKTLAEKSAKFGRFYALPLLSTDDRARVFNAANGVAGVSLKVEGEGHFRRVAFAPENPVAITKRQVMPDYDDEE